MPYPNEHACRLRDPSDFQSDTFRRTTREHEGKEYSVIMGRLAGEDTMTDQAFRYSKDVWTADSAKSHCEDHDGISFEAASGSESALRPMLTKELRAKISSTVRFKSYGAINVIKSAEQDTPDMVLVRGFFTDDQQDEVGDVITREATSKAIEKWRRWGNIRTMHEYPSGRVVKIGESDGLAWNEVITHPVDENTRRLLEGGVLKAYSVGIIPRVYDLNYDAMTDDMWFPPLVIHEYDMIEISYVDHPANYSATIEEVTEGKHKEFEQCAVVYKDGTLGEHEGNTDMENKDQEVDNRNADGLLAEDVEFHENPPEELFTTTAGDEEEEYEEVVEEKSEPGIGDILLAVDGIKEQVGALYAFIMTELPTLVANAIGTSAAEPEEGEEQHIDVSEVIEAKLASMRKDILDDVLSSLRASVGVRRSIVSVVDKESNEDDAQDKTNKYMKMSLAERRKRLTEMLEG